MQKLEFRLPDVGEGLTDAEIVTWHVNVGDTVALNQVLVEIETAKSLVELPSPYTGVIGERHGEEGDTVEVGSVLITMLDPDEKDPSTHESELLLAENDSPSVLVGYGPQASPSRRRNRTARLPALASIATGDLDVSTDRKPHTAPVDQSLRALTKPPVRMLAKKHGIDLASIQPTGPEGHITRSDVEAHIDNEEHATPTSTRLDVDLGRVPVRHKIRGVRKATAAAMVQSAFTAPHVTEFLTVDVTGTVDIVERLKADTRFHDVKVTPLLIAARAVCAAASAYPDINASWDEEVGDIVVYPDVNLGIAAATERGLIVPNIKSADRLSLHQLAHALGSLVSTARSGRTQPNDLSHGTLTITNVGTFGVDAATPILNPGEAAILCLGAIRKSPWVVDDTVVPRWTMQLSLSFDHRLVDGELGSRFLGHIGAVLTDPAWELALT